MPDFDIYFLGFHKVIYPQVLLKLLKWKFGAPGLYLN